MYICKYRPNLQIRVRQCSIKPHISILPITGSQPTYTNSPSIWFLRSSNRILFQNSPTDSTTTEHIVAVWAHCCSDFGRWSQDPETKYTTSSRFLHPRLTMFVIPQGLMNCCRPQLGVEALCKCSIAAATVTYFGCTVHKYVIQVWCVDEQSKL